MLKMGYAIPQEPYELSFRGIALACRTFQGMASLRQTELSGRATRNAVEMEKGEDHVTFCN